ncbi:hypothetical protein NKG05_14585 [Oerskovia sp. M15]
MSSSTILLAAACAATAEVAARDDCVVQVMVNNRFVPGSPARSRPSRWRGSCTSTVSTHRSTPSCDACGRRRWPRTGLPTTTRTGSSRTRRSTRRRSTTAPAGTTTVAAPARTRRFARAHTSPPAGLGRRPREPGRVTLVLHVLDAPGALDLS